MVVKFFGVFLCAVYLCAANPITIGDDKANWEAVYNVTNSSEEDVGRSDNDGNIFDRIFRINARERGSGVARSDDGVFLFQGDIAMKKSEATNMVSEKSRRRRAVGKNLRLWPKNVPYAIDGSLSRVTTNIRNAIREWEQTLPCMGSWRDVTGTNRPSDYMYFFRGSGCYSQVGRVGGAQRVSIGNGCEYHGVVVHEIGHAMGLWHEQSRPDRDDYVTIYWNNIIPNMRFNFEKYTSTRINSFGVAYDYDSVMHYGSYAFTRYRNQKTIESKPPGKRLGQRNGLSSSDKLQVQHLYGCAKTSGCQDVLSQTNCRSWKQSGYCQRTYVAYMKANCCKTCGFGSSCSDKHNNCPQWASAGYCSNSSRYHSYMKQNCARSCGCPN